MGKTRLVECAAELAAARSRILMGACLPLSREVPLLPIADAVRSAYTFDEGRWVTEALRACPAYVAPSIARLLPEAAPLAEQEDPDDEWSRPRLYSAVASLVTALAARHPLAVVIEDLHWSDDATLDLLENLVARPPRVPTILTWRSEDPDVPATKVEWLRRVQRSQQVTVLALQPLDRAASAQQLEMICGEVAPAMVDRVHARSGGLPLFTEQLATTDGEDLPPLLEDVLVTRLSQLDDHCWRVARALGIAGRGLTYDVLTASTELHEVPLTAALRELRDRRLLRTDHRTTTVELRHPLLGEAVLRMLVPGEAQTEHRRLARALATEAGAAAAEVATHWQAAHVPLEELGWRIRAARDAEARFARAQAADQWLRALDLWPEELTAAGEPPLSRFRATVAAMSALQSSAQIRRAAELADVTRRRTDLDPAEEAELCMLAGDFAGVLDDVETALGLAERAVTLFAALPASAHRVDALSTRAWMLRDLGRWEEALADIELAIEVNTEVGDEIQHRRLLAAQGWFDFAAGRRSLGLERIAAAARPSAVPDPLGDAYIAMVQSDVLLEVGAPAPEVAAATEKALRAGRRAEHRQPARVDGTLQHRGGMVARRRRRSGCSRRRQGRRRRVPARALGPAPHPCGDRHRPGRPHRSTGATGRDHDAPARGAGPAGLPRRGAHEAVALDGAPRRGVGVRPSCAGQVGLGSEPRPHRHDAGAGRARRGRHCGCRCWPRGDGRGHLADARP